MTGCSRCGKIEQLRRGLCHAHYERDRRRGFIESLVSSQRTRNHIVYLRINGWRYREVARAAGINRSLVALIVGGREKINAKTAARICGIDPAGREKYTVNGWDTRRAHQGYRNLRDDWERRHPMRPVIPRPGRWMDAALCAQVDNELFFPVKGGSTRPSKRVCRACTVRQQCLDFALANEIEHGIFGGLSALERKRILRTRGQEDTITA